MALRPGDFVVFKAGRESVLAQILTRPKSGLRGIRVFRGFVPDATERVDDEGDLEELFCAWAPTDPEFRRGEIVRVGAAAVPARFEKQPPGLDCVNLVELRRRVRKEWRSYDDDDE